MKERNDSSASQERLTKSNFTTAFGCPVLVQTAHFRCMAYQERDGKWKDYYHQDELIGKVEVVDSMDSRSVG
ncbi:MAG TPA: hypothetical protein VMA35_13780 [Candidatus Sulfopaludibacter sp.]|nr:hypothetical protein [Candidatus Sulfopaludibacter sp.]